MKNRHEAKPTVLVFAGHDPSGGAGLQADIEAIGNNHCSAVTVVTALTAQNTARIGTVTGQSPALFQEQIDLIIEEIQINACKIGLVTDAGIIDCIADTLEKLHPVPVVLDPVITAGTGDPLNKADIPELLLSRLVPLSTLVTPNSEEARQLAQVDDLDNAAERLLDKGCRAVLITGAEVNDRQIVNRLYQENGRLREYSWKKLPGTYHGSGCTLAASLSALLARHVDIESAAEEAQQYTWYCLENARQLGKKQMHPDRFFRGCGKTS